jgi:hypothetical protein
MSKKSKLKKCAYCGQEIHARGMASHIAFKHANSQTPPPVENTPTQAIETPLTKSSYSATPSRELITATQKHEDLETQLKYQLSVRSEPTEVVKQKDNGVKTPSQMPAKPTKSDWKPLAVIAGVIWLLYETIPEVRDSLQRCWRGESYMKNWLGRSNESTFR